MKWIITCRAFASIFLGGAIYLVYRNPALVMFDWIEALSAIELLANLRVAVAPLSRLIPDWVVFSLPQALWMYSGLLAIRSIWGSIDTLASRLWFGGVAMLGLSIEPMQALKLLPGTFDLTDLVLVIAAVTAASLEKGSFLCEDQGGNTPHLCLS